MKHWTVIFLISLYFLRIFASNPASVRPSTSPKDKLPLPGFAASWLDDRNAFRAGDIAMIKIKFIDFISNETDLLFDSYKVNFSLVVGGKMGNSSYVSGVLSYFEGDPSYWNITFIPFSEGEFNVVIMEEYSGITDSSLHFRVTAGDIYYPACIALWMNPMNEFISGTKVTVLILPKDAFGNNITSRMEGSDSYNFTVAAYFLNGSVANLLGIRYTGWNGLSYIGIEFIPTTAGDLFLHVLGENHTINDSPLPLKVKSGSLDISKSWGSWKYESNSLQIFSRLEFLVYQQDQFGNLVPGFYPFDARIVQKETNLSIPVGDLFFKEMTDGIQMLSFVVSEPGEFSLTIFDVVGNQSISKTPYDFKVFVGYCDGSNSVVNGSGLVSSVAGRMSSFTVYLEDMYHNPSPVEAEMLHVQILRRNDSTNVRPVIFPLRNFDESRPSAGHKHLVNGPDSTVPGLPISQNNTFAAGLKTRTSAFNVAYIPKKSGSYEISVLCGNIPLNGGHPYAMEASPGRVDISLSGVVEFSPRVKRLFRNGVVVRLMDSFTNPLPSQQTKLSFKIDTANNSSFLRWKFVDNGEGLYTGYYLSRDLGTYKLCISVDDVHLSPCPFEVNVYPREYFPEAHNDSISVWEDESVAFDVLENDYFASGHSSIIDSSIPLHGSLLLYGQLFRYTPYKGFFGNDSFSYTISDINKNLATGTALVSVLCKPPQFVSLPARLQVTEDVIGPKFGGFTGFSVRYSNTMENISVTIGAQFGTVLLAPMPLSHWHPLGNRLSISRGGNTGKDLIVAGNVQLINSALQLIQYLGNEDFYGNDIISLHARNRNGMQDAHVPIFVEPANDPPFIHAPEFIILERNETSDILQIFRKQNDTFEFSIGDPDHLNFPGNTSDFGVMLSMEVNDGILTTRLPSYLIRTVELKLMNSHQWQHLQTFVTISNHFIAKGKGIRIRGTIEDCNNALEQLLYKGVELGAVLTVSVNDMGNYGCCPDCNVRISMPLFTEVRINLIKRRPISSMTARLLGAAIIVEFIVMLILGGLLLFFICKCTNALHRESRRHSSSDIELSNLEDFSKPTLNAPYENVTYFTGHSSPFFMRTQLSNFRQRSRRVSGSGESSQHKPPLSSQFAADNEQGSSPNSFSPFSMISAKRNST